MTLDIPIQRLQVFFYNPDNRFEIKNISCSSRCYGYFDEAINQKFKDVLFQKDSQKRA